jgi:hypothetical protein
MDTSLISFSVIENDGQIQGFKLVGAGESEAESFCFTFPRAQSEKRARAEIIDGKIVFTHDGIGPEIDEKWDGPWASSEAGTFEAELTPEQASTLDDLLHGRGQYEGCQLYVAEYIRAFGKGFELLHRLST